MASETDQIIDRRRLKRSLSLWRVVAILALAVAIGGAFFLTRGDGRLMAGGDQIARIEVTGPILADRPLLRMIERIGKDDSVKAVLVAIDSPGGSTVGGESLYKALRRLAEDKPLVAHIGTIGTSAAYMTALASDHIVAWRTSITGSIGVLVQYGQVDRLLDNLGVTVGKVDTGPLKAEPSPFEPVTDEALAMLQALVDDSYDWFVDLVAERRDLAAAAVRPLADGRIMTGHQALEARLVDELGGEEAAIAWLRSEHGIAEGLPVRTRKPRRRDQDGFLFMVADRIAIRLVEALGGGGGALPPSFLDGLTSVWQGPGSQSNAGPEATFE